MSNLHTQILARKSGQSTSKSAQDVRNEINHFFSDCAYNPASTSWQGDGHENDGGFYANKTISCSCTKEELDVLCNEVRALFDDLSDDFGLVILFFTNNNEVRMEINAFA
ncbi:MAG: hypothetical protein ACI9TY_001014 [Alphaproteobacteria bacterium]|jgi:hypothetical protein